MDRSRKSFFKLCKRQKNRRIASELRKARTPRDLSSHEEPSVSAEEHMSATSEEQIPVADGTTVVNTASHSTVGTDDHDLSVETNLSVGNNLSVGTNDQISNSPENVAVSNSNLAEKLKEWALNNSIARSHVSSLLKILKPLHPQLPTDSRTLLKTPIATAIVNMPPGSYVHFGLYEALTKLFDLNNKINNNEPVSLSLNVDGLPIFKSSTASLWPILLSLSQSNHVVVVGIFYGPSKPSLEDFLERFISEYNKIYSEGFLYKNLMYSIKIKSLVCDTPAKSFMLNVKGHTGFNSCTKCRIRGKHENFKTFFPDISLKTELLRTDEDYRCLRDAEFHLGTTPLIELEGFDFINNVPYDYMHLVCLGIVKKLIMLWHTSKIPHHILKTQACEISDRLMCMSQYTPKEFGRKPRSLIYYKMWKATEFRQFLLYTGFSAMFKIVEPAILLNFTSLMCSIRIFCAEELVDIDYGHELIEYFVQTFKILYNAENMSHNVHGLLHLSNDVREHGNLDGFSSFKFENHLQKMKKMVKKSSQPLQQIHNRLMEGGGRKIGTSKGIVVSSKHTQGPLTPPITVDNCTQYSRAYANGALINTKSPANRTFSFKNGSIGQICNICVDNAGGVKVLTRLFLSKENLFEKPCPSTSVGYFLVRNLSLGLEIHNIDDIKKKMYCFPNPSCKESYVAVEMLHLE